MTTAKASVRTTQITDPRIEPSPDPVYGYVIGPTQNQYYRCNSSALSDTFVAFNNLTTLGTDRAYLDTMELEITADITFTKRANSNLYAPAVDSWTFDSFPFNKCCDQIRANINGGAFFSEPLSYLRAKERYMNQEKLQKSYQNICPVQRAYGQTESGRTYWQPPSATPNSNSQSSADALLLNTPNGWGFPTRYGRGIFNTCQSEVGLTGFNNDIVRVDNITNTATFTKYTVTWREPICCSPFSSKYDATYGRPLYNITSLDIAFTLNDLRNMIRCANFDDAQTAPGGGGAGDDTAPNAVVSNYTITLKTVDLMYQVLTIPTTINKPLTTLVPYRRFVPYITQGPTLTNAATGIGQTQYRVKSGTYTLNEIPTAIWVFLAPTKSAYQQVRADNITPVLTGANRTTDNTLCWGNFDNNRLFGYLETINISLANTTQILSTARPYDLYRIARANGCEDSYLAWSGPAGAVGGSVLSPHQKDATRRAASRGMYLGPGSVLRLIPGVDIIIPDHALIPGANANNMVFQCEAEFTVPDHSPVSAPDYALWLLFEYVGVAAISPGQCEITMNPLGSGEVMAVSPVVSGTTDATDGVLGSGSGFWEMLKKKLSVANEKARQTKFLSQFLKGFSNPTVKKMGEFLEDMGYGEPSCKKCKGGAEMSLKDWT